MTEAEEIQELIAQDSEFNILYSEAKTYTDNPLTNVPEELAEIYKRYFEFPHKYTKDVRLPINKFLAKYKVIMAWAAMMGKVLRKISGKDQFDRSALKPIRGTDYGYIIYEKYIPKEIKVWFNEYSNEYSIKVQVAIKSNDRDEAKTKYADIKFKLSYIYDFKFDGNGYMQVAPNLLETTMDVELYTEIMLVPFYKEKIKIKEFTPDKLEDILKMAVNI